jgi:dipeptidase
MEKYHEYFLNGQLDFNDEEIIYEKDLKKDAKEDESNRPKRQRGRPRKIKIINDDLIPNSDNNDEDSSPRSDSDDDDESDFTS